MLGGYTGHYFSCESGAGSQGTTYYSIASSNLFANKTYPPYGWIISATADGYHFCAGGGCVTGVVQSTPQNPAYYPVGPRLSGTLPCSGSFFGNIYEALFQGCGSGISMSVNQNGTVAIFMPNGAETENSELLFARLHVENYTKVAQGTPVYKCYTDAQVDLCSRWQGPEPIAQEIKGPIFAVGDPFRYVENLGSQKVYAFENLYSSEFTGGGSGAQGAYGLSQACQNQVSSFSVPAGCVSNPETTIPPISLPTSSQISFAGQPSYPANVPVLQSSVSGVGFVPYKYTYTLEQSWSNFRYESGGTGGLFGYVCPPTLPPSSDTESKTVYSYAQTLPYSSPPLSANVEGGDTYLQYRSGSQGNGYYVQNLSDMGLYLSTHLLFNFSTDRQFGNAYVGLETPSGRGSDMYQILNATQQLGYAINQYAQQGGQFETISSKAVGPYYGSQYAFSANALGATPAVGVPANFLFGEAPSPPPHFGDVILFDWYKENVYDGPLNLYIPKSLGYQRVMYALNDKFNNNILVPLDGDVVHITVLAMNISTTVSVGNSNQTALSINGIAGEDTYNGLDVTALNFIPLKNAYVYLYYNRNINYVNSITGAPLDTAAAQLCAFGSPSSPYLSGSYPSACNLANPEWQGLQAGADAVNYAPAYTSSTGNKCGPPPNSLLVGSITPMKCNIYGYNSIPQLCPAGSGGAKTYCYPIYENGSGICSPQLGLIQKVETNNQGEFSSTTTACGIGQAEILAVYYGDSLQPITVTEPSLDHSGDMLLFGTQQQGYGNSQYTLNAISYNWMPNQTSTLIEIGLFELSFGEISAVVLVAAIAAALLILFYMHRVRKGKKRKRRKG